MLKKGEADASADASAESSDGSAAPGIGANARASAESSADASAESSDGLAALDIGANARASAESPRDSSAPIMRGEADASDLLDSLLAEIELEPQPAANDPTEQAERRADAMVDVARAYLRHRPRTLGAGYELVVITTPEHLREGQDGVGGF